MEDRGGTQLLDPTEVEPQTQPQGAGAPPSGGKTANASGTSGFPRRWIVLAIVAVLLLAAGIAALLLLGGDGGDVASAEVGVPDVRGMTLERAGQEVLAAGLAPGTVQYAIVDESVTPSGTVLSQDPLPGALVAPGTTMSIVLAQGKAADAAAAAQADEAAASASADTAGDSGGSTPPPPSQEQVLPDLPPADSIDYIDLQPHVVNPGIWNVLEPMYRTVLHHSEFGGDWQSPAVVFGDKPKRISITADGPINYPIAVWYWGPNDADWRLANISPSGPGAYESDSENSGTFQYDFKVGAGTHTILVRAHTEIVWWAIKIEEQE